MWSKTERGHFSFPRSSLKTHSSKQPPKQANDFNKSDDVTMGVTYRKIPKISPGAFIFQRPFLRGLFLEGVILFWRGLSTEGNLHFKIYWASLILGRKFTVFALFYFVFEGNFQIQAPWGAYI